MLRLLVAILLLAGPASVEGQVAGQYTDLFGFYHHDNLRAEMTRTGGSRFGGELAIAMCRGVFDVDTETLKGDRFELARKGTAAAARLEWRQEIFERMTLTRRAQEDQMAAASGALVAETQGAISSSRSRLDAARGLPQQCGIVADWAARFGREFPGGRANSAPAIMMAINLFGDEDFVPVFGRAYDQTTLEWRGQINKKYLTPCLTGKSDALRSRVDQQLAGLLVSAFSDVPGNGYGPARIVPIVTSRRALVQKLTALAHVDDVLSPADVPSVLERIGQVANFEELWPSTLNNVRAGLTQGAVQAVARWQMQLAALPVSLQNAARLSDELDRSRGAVASLKDAEAGRHVAVVGQHLDDMLTALAQSRLAELSSLREIRGPSPSWTSWRAIFERDFKPFLARTPIETARRAAAAAVAPLLNRGLPQWEAKIRALPSSPEGAESARTALAELFAGDEDRRSVTYVRYELAVARAKGAALGRALEARDPVESFKWYQLAADLGNAEAQYAVGQVYFNRRFYRESAAWFLMAAAQDHHPAQRLLGQQYLNGQGVPVDRAEAARWLTRAGDDAKDRR